MRMYVYVCVYLVCVCPHANCMQSSEGVLGPLELELLVFVSNFVGPGGQLCSSLRAAKTLTH